MEKETLENLYKKLSEKLEYLLQVQGEGLRVQEEIRVIKETIAKIVTTPSA